jgi:hypothetical protein
MKVPVPIRRRQRLGYTYGVFAAPEFQHGSEYGFIYVDDEDDHHQNVTSGDDVFRVILSGSRNTQFDIWRR